MGDKNGKNGKKAKQQPKVKLNPANDQLGENASEEFARDYANKGKHK